MDLAALAQSLIDKHARKHFALAPLIKATAFSHFRQGVEQMLRAVQDMALDDSMKQQLGGAVIHPAPEPEVTAPMAVQPNHAATE